MKITTRLLCLLILLSSTSFSQKTSDALLLSSGKIYPAENVNEFIAEKISSSEVVDGYYYRIIQFRNFPNAKQKAEIQSSGIIVNYYLPYHAYSCAIPQNFDKSKLVGLEAHSVIKWEDSYKIHRSLVGFSFPSHTIIEKGKADLVVHYHQNISPARAKELFEAKGFKIINSIDATHVLVLRVAFEKMQKLVSLPFVYFIEPISPPPVKDDTEGRSLHRSNIINSDYTTGRHYDGNGVAVGLADDGMIGPHIDFTGRVTQHLTGLGGHHGDMTSGICVGAGNRDPKIKGMGTGAYLHVFDIGGYPHVLNAEANYASDSIVILSTSYAQVCNQYTSDSELGDQLIHNNPPFSFCFSAGNEGGTDCNYGAGNLWGNITGGYKLGKNVIAVGNLDEDDVIQGSSSRGPAIDGRIKPEICSYGNYQNSTDEDNTNQGGSGTSAACPGVAGTLSQLYQEYKSLTGELNPPGGLIKACVLNSAEDLGNTGPDFIYGWGRINAYRAALTIEDHRYLSDSIDQGNSNTHTINVPSGVRQLRVMLYWNDIEGNPSAAKALVNDLNMQITNPSSATFNPWVLDPTPTVSALNSLPVRGIDSLNNVEQITIDNPASGAYTISVDGFQIPLGKQNYYIVYEYRTDTITVTYPAGGEGVLPNDLEKIRWDAFGNAGTFDIDYSDNNGSTWSNVASGVSGDSRFYDWGVPSTISDEALIRVSRNSFSDESDTTFTIIDAPQNLRFEFACPDSIGLAWDAVPGTTGYDVSMLGTKYMDLIGTTTATHFTKTGTIPIDENWFSVKALGPNGGKGQRAVAIKPPLGTFDCHLSLDGGIKNVLSPATGLFSDCLYNPTFPITITIWNPGLSPISNFNLIYNVNGANTFSETFSGTIAPGDSAVYTFSQTSASITTGHYILKIWMDVTGDLNIYNDTAIVPFTIVPGTVGLLGMEDFESMTLCSNTATCENGICNLSNGWINGGNGTADDIDWRVNQDTTPTTSTGPVVDHTTASATGNYIYLEGSNCFEQEAELLSPCFDLTGMLSPKLTFWYHMYGFTMGELHIDLLTANRAYIDFISPHRGPQGIVWHRDSVSLDQFIGQTVIVRFRGITGNETYSDMALDDINVSDQSTGITEANSSVQFLIYPNPGTDVFNFVFGNNSDVRSKIVVEDILGKIIFEKNISEAGMRHTGVIDLSGQPRGIYTATLRSDKFSKQVKIIKMN